MTEEKFVPDDPEEYVDGLVFYPPLLSDAVHRLGIDPDSIRSIFDGGCGYGASTVSLAKLFNESEIWAVSKLQGPTPEVRKRLGERLHFSPKKIIDFLRENEQTYDVVFFGKIPSTGLTTKEDYDLLASRVNPNGYVMGYVPVNLYDREMSDHFRELQLPPEALSHNFISVWQKIDQ